MDSPVEDHRDRLDREDGTEPPLTSSVPAPVLLTVALSAFLIAGATLIMTLPLWLDGSLFSTLVALTLGGVLFLAGIYTASGLIPETSKVRARVQKPLTTMLAWSMIGMTVTRSLLVLYLTAAFALAAVYAVVWAGSALLLTTDVPEATVTFLAYAVGLLAVAYASPWTLYLPAIAIGRWLDRGGASGNRDVEDAMATVVLLVATRVDFRQVAYVLGTAGLLITMTLGTIPEDQHPPWSGSVSIAAQALLLFIAVDQYLATFHQERVLDRMKEAHRRALARALGVRPDGARPSTPTKHNVEPEGL